MAAPACGVAVLPMAVVVSRAAPARSAPTARRALLSIVRCDLPEGCRPTAPPRATTAAKGWETDCPANDGGRSRQFILAMAALGATRTSSLMASQAKVKRWRCQFVYDFCLFCNAIPMRQELRAVTPGEDSQQKSATSRQTSSWWAWPSISSRIVSQASSGPCCLVSSATIISWATPISTSTSRRSTRPSV